MQRFNSALELALHFHILCPDGLFLRDGAHPDTRPRFGAQDPPSELEVSRLLDRIIKRITRLMRRHGLLAQDPCSLIDEESADTQRQLLLASSRRPGPPRWAGAAPRQDSSNSAPALCARKEGYSLHAATSVHANDRRGVERLCRYGLRPALSLDRLSELPDGHLVYRMKRTFSDGTNTVRLTPRELLLRLCALIPPPGFHQVRYAGIFSGHARGRFALTGRGMRANPSGARPTSGPSAHLLVPSNKLLPAHLRLDLADLPDEPWRQRRLAWATLLERTYGIEVLICPSCQGRMRIIAFIQDERIAKRILDHLGLPSRAPPRGPRSLPGQQPLPFDGTGPNRQFDGIDPLPLD